MNPAACLADLDAGVVRSVLAAVDCQTRVFAQGGYTALTGPGSPLPAILTVALTIYVALIGWGMLFGRGMSFGEVPRIAVRIGLVLALVGGWPLFQTLVFDVADQAPLQIARVASGPSQAQGGSLAGDPLGGLQTAYDELSESARAFGKLAGPTARAYTSGEAAAAEALSVAATVQFMSTAGLLAVGLMAVAVLTALGPVFVILCLFPQTRGLFVGWTRAVIAAALIPAGVWALAVISLAVLEPWLVELARQRGEGALDPDTALAAASVVFVFGAGQVLLAAAAAFIAAGLKMPRRERAPASSLSQIQAPRTELADLSRPQRLALALQRADLAVPSVSAETARVGVAAAADGRRRTTDERFAASPRIGDAYRRPAFRGRRAAEAGA